MDWWSRTKALASAPVALTLPVSTFAMPMVW